MSFLVPHRHDALVVRRALPADAAAIARVQVQSWREAYGGIVPQPYLDQLSAAREERQWRGALAAAAAGSGGGTGQVRPAGPRVFVAEWERQLVGIVSGGLSRVRRDISGEIYVLYLLRGFQRRGIGRALFDACHYELARCGHRGLLVWVLADNAPARRFYERLGGIRSGESHTQVGAARLREVAYIWPD